MPGRRLSQWLEQARKRATLSPIARRIALLLTLFSTATAFVLVALLIHLRGETIAASEKLGTTLARLTEDQTTRTLQNVWQTLELVERRMRDANAFSEAPLGSVDLRSLLSDRPFLRSIWVVDAHGRSIYGSEPSGVGIDTSQRRYFTYHRDDPASAPRLGRPMQSAVTGEWVVPASMPVRDTSGRLLGVIVGAVNAKFFDSVWNVQGVAGTTTTALIRDDGYVLIRSPFD